MRRNATAVGLAPEPKDVETVNLGHIVACVCVETKPGADAPEQFMFRMGGLGEEMPKLDVPVCDYTMACYRDLLHSRVGDEISYPGKGAAKITEILMPHALEAKRALKAAA